MVLQWIVYAKNDLGDESEFMEMLSRSEYSIICCDNLSGEDVVLLQQNIAEAIGEKRNISDCLMIVTSDTQYQAACHMHLATLPYIKSQALKHPLFDGAWMVAEGLAEVDEDFLNKAYQRFHHLPWTILYTPRCYLREISMADMDALFALYAQKGVTDYMEPLYDRPQEEEYERAYIEHMYRYFGYGMWLVCDRQTNEIIGRAGLEHRDYGDETELEMGYLVSPMRQRMGYATEICLAIMEYARKNLDFPRLNCLIETENKASIHLVEKLGFCKLESTGITGKAMERYVFDL